MSPTPLFAATPAHFAEFRVVLLPLLAGAAAIWLLLPRPQGRQLFIGAVLGILALVLGGLVIVNVGGVSVETVLFYTFSGLAVVSGTLMLTQHNPARAALSFTLVVLSVCGLFLLLGAPFLMAATVIIYAGAIVVTFLFVLMLAQQTGLSDADMRSREPLLSSLTGFILLGALLYVIRLGYQTGAKDLDPFLSRIREAAAKELAADMERTLNRDPQELNEAVERLWQDSGSKKKRDELVNTLKDESADFSTRLRQALEMLGQTDLAFRTQDEPRRFRFPDLKAPDATERAREVLKNYEALVLAARQRVGLLQPDSTNDRYQSGLSGPPSAATGGLRRDASGRPESPAENSAHLGKSLFTDYLLPVEIGGFLLLIATIGAIAIAHRQTPSPLPLSPEAGARGASVPPRPQGEEEGRAS